MFLEFCSPRSLFPIPHSPQRARPDPQPQTKKYDPPQLQQRPADFLALRPKPNHTDREPTLLRAPGGAWTDHSRCAGPSGCAEVGNVREKNSKQQARPQSSQAQQQEATRPPPETALISRLWVRELACLRVADTTADIPGVCPPQICKGCRQDASALPEPPGTSAQSLDWTWPRLPPDGLPGRLPLQHTDQSQKSLAPPTHVDTLNSNPAFHQPSNVPPPFQTPAPKRSKIHDARGPDEDIVEVEQDAGSRQEHYGSQSSFAAQLASPGVAEFQSVEASVYRTSRPNRRGRKQYGDNPSAMNHHGRTVRSMESIESFDELALPKKPAAGRQRTARLVVINDAADDYILGKPSRVGKQQHSLKKTKKRPSHDVPSDHDELVDDSAAEAEVSGRPKSPTKDWSKHKSSGLSRRGEIKPTKWASAPRATDTPLNVRVEAAVCQPNLRFVADKEQSSCFLRPSDDGLELRAFMESGSTAGPYPWLKITGKTRTLTYHPASNLIKINQSNDQTLAISIGALMVIRLGSSSEAVQVADWARGDSRIHVVQEKTRYGCPISRALAPFVY